MYRPSCHSLAASANHPSCGSAPLGVTSAKSCNCTKPAAFYAIDASTGTSAISCSAEPITSCGSCPSTCPRCAAVPPAITPAPGPGPVPAPGPAPVASAVTHSVASPPPVQSPSPAPAPPLSPPPPAAPAPNGSVLTPPPPPALSITPTPPSKPFQGVVQVFISLTNLSSTPSPNTGRKMLAARQPMHGDFWDRNLGRKLLQVPQDDLLFGVLLVPSPTGSAPLSKAPNSTSALYYQGVAASGNVTIFANGNFLTNVRCSSGQGSQALLVPRIPLFFTAGFSGGAGFPGSSNGTANSAIVTLPDGSTQAFSFPSPPPPSPPSPYTVGFNTTAPPTQVVAGQSQSSRVPLAAIIVPAVVGFIIIALALILLIFIFLRWRKTRRNRRLSQVVPDDGSPDSDPAVFSALQITPAVRVHPDTHDDAPQASSTVVVTPRPAGATAVVTAAPPQKFPVPSQPYPPVAWTWNPLRE
ncbi:hypothetical protein WJX73_010205 [Symbiochloris irregularis]|uniref:Uncharacterized protein n=1 Tax=Symbiochloris irregularis TaxID=706552 RepID=A0AAW1NXE3_9CHLO